MQILFCKECGVSRKHEYRYCENCGVEYIIDDNSENISKIPIKNIFDKKDRINAYSTIDSIYQILKYTRILVAVFFIISIIYSLFESFLLFLFLLIFGALIFVLFYWILYGVKEYDNIVRIVLIIGSVIILIASTFYLPIGYIGIIISSYFIISLNNKHVKRVFRYR